MIKINFLNSYREFAESQGFGSLVLDEGDRQQLIKDVAKRFAILALGPIGFYIYEIQTIPVLFAKRDDMLVQIASHLQFNDSKQGLAEEIQRYQDDQTRFNTQMDFINKIQADKLNEYKLFLHLKESTPPTVWINSLTLRENLLTIDGVSVDPNGISVFMEKLSTTDFISNLIPVNQNTSPNFQDSGVDTFVFQIKAQLNVTAKSPTSPTSSDGGGN
jgi:Tfp pilus assembly protein PilN